MNQQDRELFVAIDAAREMMELIRREDLIKKIKRSQLEQKTKTKIERWIREGGDLTKTTTTITYSAQEKPEKAQDAFGGTFGVVGERRDGNTSLNSNKEIELDL